jgi:hypothetical protein
MIAASGQNPSRIQQRLAELKATRARNDRPLDRPAGRWLGDFLDKDTESGLLSAEEQLLEACAKGDACFAVGEGQKPRADNGSGHVRATFLRFLVLGGDESAPVHESGVELHRAWIDDKLDLRGGKCVGRLGLVDCMIQGALRIEDASLGNLYLAGSQLQGIAGNRAQIAGSVFLEREFISEGTVQFFGAEIGGSLQCGGAKIRLAEMPKQQTRFDALICSGAKIRGNVLLTDGFETEGAVWFNNAEIGGNLDCGGAKLLRTKLPDGKTQFDVLICTGTKIKGNALLNKTFEANGSVRFNNAEVGGNLDCGGAKLLRNKPQNGQIEQNAEQLQFDALLCRGAKITGNVLLNRSFETDGCAELFNAEIGGSLDCDSAKFVRSKTRGAQNGAASDGQTPRDVLICTAAKIRSDVCLTGQFEAEGAVWFNNAEIAGNLLCSHATFSNGVGFALCCDQAKTASDTQLDDVTIKGTVSFINARVGASFVACGCNVDGLVSLYGAEIGRDVNCSGSRFTNRNNTALCLDTAEIKGSVFLSQICSFGEKKAGQRFEADGGVSLYSTHIGRHLECIGGRFNALNGDIKTPAIRADALVVGGCVFLCGPMRETLQLIPNLAKFSSKGEVRLVGAEIGLQLNCTNAEFEHPAPNEERPDAAGYALNLGLVSVKGELLLGTPDQTDHPPAKIHGSINLSGAKTRELADRGFVSESGPELAYFPLAVAEEIIRNGAGSSNTPDNAFSGLKCEMLLDGFRYERLNANSCLQSKAREAWLLRQPKGHLYEQFRYQPFDHLIGVLRAMGQMGPAREIAIFKQRRLTTSLVSRFNHIDPSAFFRVFRCLLRGLFDLFVSYGYKPGKGVIIALFIAWMMGWFYGQAEEQGAIVRRETQEQRAVSQGVKTQEAKTQFHPYVYSLDVMLPVVKLGEADAWKPSGTGFRLRLPFGLAEPNVDKAWTQYVIWIEILFGWLAGGLLLAVVSGLIKKD